MLTMQEEISISNISSLYKTITINKFDIILNDGVEISRTNPHSCAFYPGQIDEVKNFTGWNDLTPEIVYLQSIWTQDVIDAYNASQSEQQP